MFIILEPKPPATRRFCRSSTTAPWNRQDTWKKQKPKLLAIAASDYVSPSEKKRVCSTGFHPNVLGMKRLMHTKTGWVS